MQSAACLLPYLSRAAIEAYQFGSHMFGSWTVINIVEKPVWFVITGCFNIKPMIFFYVAVKVCNNDSVLLYINTLRRGGSETSNVPLI